MSCLPTDDLFPVWRKEWILHQDEDLFIVDKPPSIPTHAPDPGRIDDAYSRLKRWLKTSAKKTEPYLGIHQRLDNDTSGVLLFTCRKEANPAVARQFEQHLVRKTYVAAVAWPGHLPKKGHLNHRLIAGKDGFMQALPYSHSQGQLAVTEYRVLTQQHDRALVELRPETGRTHQLRVQLAVVQMPIVGDKRYGGQPANRLYLHATELSLTHPSTGQMVTFRSPLPTMFNAWLTNSVTKPFQSVDAIETIMRNAAEKRYGLAHTDHTNAFRLLHGAGDDLAGVSVDAYGEYLVVALFSDEAERERDKVLDAADRLGAKGVYLKVRPKDASRIVDSRQDAYAPPHAVRGESARDAFCIKEHDLAFEVHLGDGLSTGLFLDQRENRRRVREMASGKRVLNLFAYTCGFTVAAVQGGAHSTTSIDASATTMAWAQRNLDRIGASPKDHVLIKADVFQWLKQRSRGSESFDLILLDPPSFATTKHSRFSAKSDYTALAAQALRLLAAGGRLLACTNHQGIARHRLRRYLHDAARSAGCSITQMKDLPDPIDFPPEPGTESHLKSVLVTIGNRR